MGSSGQSGKVLIWKLNGSRPAGLATNKAGVVEGPDQDKYKGTETLNILVKRELGNDTDHSSHCIFIFNFVCVKQTLLNSA